MYSSYHKFIGRILNTFLQRRSLNYPANVRDRIVTPWIHINIPSITQPYLSLFSGKAEDCCVAKEY